MTIAARDVLAQDVHPQELRMQLLAARYGHAGQDDRQAILEQVLTMTSGHRCAFFVAVAASDPATARDHVAGLRYAADRLRVLRALVNAGWVGLDERMRELELAQAIEDPQA